MITTNLDRIWQRVVEEIPSRHLPNELSRNIFGCRSALAEFADGWESPHGVVGMRYLEVGCRLGHSLATVALTAGLRLDKAVVVDMWIKNYGDESNPGPSAVLKHLDKLGVGDAPIEMLEGSSHTILPWLNDGKTQFDLILVDGDHTEQGAAMDLRDCTTLLAPNGLLVFDDAVEPLLMVWRTFAKDSGLTCEEHLDSYYPWCSARKVTP